LFRDAANVTRTSTARLRPLARNSPGYIRAYVNANPKINRSIQFNSLVGLGGTGVGAAMLEGEETREPRR
jgi:hypothetical protein